MVYSVGSIPTCQQWILTKQQAKDLEDSETYMITFINHRELIKANNFESLNYSERFKMYCKDFPEMEALNDIRDCELVQIWDQLKQGHQLQSVIDALAIEWLEEENENSWDDLSQELRSFLTLASKDVMVTI